MYCTHAYVLFILLCMNNLIVSSGHPESLSLDTIGIVQSVGFDKYISYVCTFIVFTELFHCPQNPLCSTYLFFPLTNPCQLLIF